MNGRRAEAYWLFIEPYVYVKMTEGNVFLYNTLDGSVIKSNRIEVVEIISTILKDENGVVLLREEKFHNKIVKGFVNDLRKKYMGDAIDVAYSNNKPVQIMPLCNLQDVGINNIYNGRLFSNVPVLDCLNEISFYVDDSINADAFISFINTLPVSLDVNLIGDITKVNGYIEILSFFVEYSFSSFAIYDGYKTAINLISKLEHFYFKLVVVVDYPIDLEIWDILLKQLIDYAGTYKFIFHVTSDEDYWESIKLIETYSITDYEIIPVYIGTNFNFFRANVFLSENDFQNSIVSMKEILTHQILNTNDFGKLIVRASGDVYANTHFPCIGNIYINNIKELVETELKTGLSWLRIRDKEPCQNCFYQWLCPSPSTYELEIGQVNLCKINVK